jgi:hypothetical protein
MARVEQTPQPYAYPRDAHQRRHGPAGYANYHDYRPWLEDEFSFRCVYCLKRMVWAPTDIWAVDHLVSRRDAPHLECHYENLVFACQFCNGQKGPARVPDPCRIAYGTCLQVESDGTVTPRGRSGRRLVKVLRLNHKWHVAERLKIIRLLASLARHDQGEFDRFMGFPSDLPDLGGRRPPGGNHRPHGIAESCFARKQRGELPRVY